MKTILALLMLATPTLADHCRKQNVVIQSTGQVIVPFAVPVATPVAVVSPYAYQHSGGSKVYSNEVRTSDSKLFEEFLAWRSKREAEASSNQVRTQEIPQTLVQQNCVACHTPGNPKSKSLAIEALDMSTELTSDQKLSAIKALLLGSMPPGKTIDAQLRSDLAAELSGVKPGVSK